MIPLYSVETEQSLLGALYLDAENGMPKVMRVLKAEDFYDPKHQAIYGAMVKLAEQNKGIDYLTVLNLDKTISASYLTSLADSMPTTTHLKDYIEAVKNFSLARQVLKRVSAFNDAVADGGDIDVETDRLLQDMLDVKSKSNDGAVNVSKIIGPVYEMVNSGAKQGLRCGYPSIDDLTLGFHPGEMTLLCAATSVGKTTMALNMTRRIAEDGYNVLFFSLETTKERITQNLLTIVGGVETRTSIAKLELQRNVMPDYLEDIKHRRREGAKRLSDYPIWIDDNHHNINSLASEARKLKMLLTRNKESLSLIVVDYLQFMDRDERERNTVRQVAKLSQGLKKLCKELHVPILVLAQVNDDARKDKRKYIATDIRESKDVAMDADTVIFLCRDEKDLHSYDVLCAKQRHGPTFSMPFTFNPDIITFTEGKPE